MKTCSVCQGVKELTEFPKNGKSGVHPQCKPCYADKARNDRKLNPEKYRELEKSRYLANDSKKKAIARYYEANKEEIKARNRQRYAEKKERIKADAKEYRANNKHKVREWNGTRRAKTRLAMPVWADRARIAEIYAEASRLTEVTGEPHHVDHMIPLSNKLVCGLHVPDNLQVLKGSENLRKSNRF